MRIILVQPPTPIIEKAPSLGLGYVGATLGQRGHTVRIIHAGKERMSLRALSAACREFSPHLIGIQSFSFFHNVVIEFAAMMKSFSPEAKIVVGGPHPSGMRGDIFSGSKHIDYAFAGEAEKGSVELAEAIESGAGFEKVSGLIWKSNGGVRVNPIRQVKDLDDIPFPLWDQLAPQDYSSTAIGFFAPAFPIAPFITSRGCDKSCSFCQHVMKGLRMRSIGNCMEELDYLWKHFSISAFALLDQNFAFSENRVIEFCDALAKTGRAYKWYCPNGIRLETLTQPMVASMRAAGCHSVAVGIESVSPDVLEDMNKELAADVVKKGLSLLRAGGMKITGNFILGFPGESALSLKSTIRFSISLPITRANFSAFVPFPGTKYFRDIFGDKDASSIRWDTFDVFSTTNAVTMSPLKLRFYMVLSYLYFYIRPAVLFEALRDTPLRRYPFLARRVWSIMTKK